MLGWEQESMEPAQPRQPLPRTDRVFVLLAQLARGGRWRLAEGAAVLGLVMELLGLLRSIPWALLPIMLAGPALVIWLGGAAA
jgi:hypothetical protein